MKNINSRIATAVSHRQPMKMIGVGLIVGTIAVTASACGGSSSDSSAPAATKAAPVAKTVNIEMIGKIDADKGPAGTFTSKEHWPAMAPSDLTLSLIHI